ncbi:GNAT family N-acetyltransferase [Psychroserpens algicola]|uniref:GNAT family N-acetyltransferase n=1 Tax=Psychroserpens algicola TaxID=1719034 RepID=A0ABT0HBN9_9FLAO|nr:GNAT family N-acetyltransferase [Psychroserpens algicola]MCK8481751.1 GNAT family N-acetyltransferase [Psychroserpens algicola]
MIHYKLYNSVADLPNSWDELHVDDIFLKTPFLKALENSSPTNISTYFLGVFVSDSLVGIATIQRVEMYLDDVFRKTSNQFFKRCGKMLISKIVKGNALIVGNLMHTGQHGLFFDSSALSQDEFLNCISEGIKELTTTIKKNYGKKIRIIGFKDYFENDSIHHSTSFFRSHKLYKAKVQPNMIFDVSPDWNSPEDYVSAFNKKYRRRYKTARKKCTDIHCKELNLQDVKTFSKTLYELYENVSDNAGVNSFKLHQNHFYSLKLQLQDTFKVFGYFLNDDLVGFYTLIRNHDKLETYFLGYKQDLQHQYQMYLNMLFDMVFYGISNQYKTVIFARTAMEIKSSVGAQPHDMYIYLKHTNNVIANTILKLVVKYANPIRDWEERHPFGVSQ